MPHPLPLTTHSYHIYFRCWTYFPTAASSSCRCVLRWVYMVLCVAVFSGMSAPLSMATNPQPPPTNPLQPPSQFPYVARALAPLGPVNSLYHIFPFFPLIVFLAVYSGVANNPSLSRYVRINALQAILLDVLLM